MISSILSSKHFSFRRSERIHGIPWLVLMVVIAISSLGVACLYSAAKGNMEPWANKQLIYIALGTCIMLVTAFFPIKLWIKLAYPAYAVGISTLLAVMLVGVEGGYGAQRWIEIAGFKFQPSEFMKLFMVMAIARYYHNLSFEKAEKFYSILIPGILILVAAILIKQQPHLGTAVIITMMGGFLLFYAGVDSRLFIVGAIIVILAIPAVIKFELIKLDAYQMDRITTFMNPEKDSRGKGYNIIQSMIAIGSGGINGKGFMQGTQSQLNFVPEKHTDFIFTIVAEEFGFVGSIVTIGLYGMLILLGIQIAARCRSTFGKLMAAGVSSMMMIHCFINMGMVSALLPVVGIPLPLLTYGGSSMLSTMFGIGLLMNAHVYRDAVIGKDL